VFFNVINIFDSFTHCLLLYIININLFHFNVNFFEQTNGNPLTPTTEASLWLNMYASFAGGSLILYLLSSGIFVWCAINASKHFHHEVLTTLLKGKKKGMTLKYVKS